MIIKRVCKNVNESGNASFYMGLDNQGSLWASTDASLPEEKWELIAFNTIYKGYYPVCRFTALCATEKDFVAAGLGGDGLPYVFCSLMGGVWESVPLLFGNSLTGYQRAGGKIIEILYDSRIRQLFMLCGNGELVTIPDCPKCAKIRKVTDEKVLGGFFSNDNRMIILTTAAGEELRIPKEEAVQIRISSDYAEMKIKEGGILVDLREMDIDNLGEWLETQSKDQFIAFLCNYGVQSDRAAEYARGKGFYQAFSMGGARLDLYP